MISSPMQRNPYLPQHLNPVNRTVPSGSPMAPRYPHPDLRSFGNASSGPMPVRNGAPSLHPHMNPLKMNLLRTVKRLMYSQLGIINAVQVLRDKQNPYIDFKVENHPPAIYLNYRIKPEKLEDFKKAMHIPPDIKLLPVTTMEGGKPEYTLTLNAYRVSGSLINQLRADWSVYIDRGDGKPAYLVVDAFSDKHSMDPVHVVTKPTDYVYTEQHNNHKQLDLAMKMPSGKVFEFHYPDDVDKVTREALPDRTWLAANDFVFWKNGVCDQVYMDGHAYNSPYKQLPVADCMVNAHDWHEFVEARPYEALALTEPALFIVSPWANLSVKNNTPVLEVG